jgi:hypothetical protein
MAEGGVSQEIPPFCFFGWLLTFAALRRRGLRDRADDLSENSAGFAEASLVFVTQ